MPRRYNQWPEEVKDMVREIVTYMQTSQTYFSSTVITERLRSAIEKQELSCPNLNWQQVVAFVRHEMGIDWKELKR